MAKVMEYLFMITLHDTVVSQYLWKSDSRTACRYQNLSMPKSLTQNGIFLVQNLCNPIVYFKSSVGYYL